jgi:hypothetical protein
MAKGKTLIVASVLVISGCAFGSIASAEPLKREPPMGALRENERVLVDDGTCPSGQIKEVIGGNHIKVGGTKRIERTRHCIPKH